jgi:hypothetical protein
MIVLSVTVASAHDIERLVGERLEYGISFLWFDHLAEGEVTLEPGPQEDTWLIVMQARTLGIAAAVTRNRVDKYETLIEVAPDGLLRPIWHKAHTIKGNGTARREKTKQYDFDYVGGQVRYRRLKNGKSSTDKYFAMNDRTQMYDILSALYNLRLGYYGEIGQQEVHIPTFHHEGEQDIVIAPLYDSTEADRKFLETSSFLCQVLVDPSVFGTNGRDVLVGFDNDMRPIVGIIKNVIGLGDVRGTLRSVTVVR